MRALLITALLVGLIGCAAEPVFLKHPGTGQTAKCGPYYDTFGRTGVAEAMREAQCIQDYKDQGFVRAP